MRRRATRTAELSLPAETRSTGAARRFVADALGGWGCDGLVDDAVLAVSELVTNAVVHAGTACRVVLRLGGGRLRIEVADAGGGSPRALEPSTTRTGGRGLHLVESIADAWGVERDGRGKVVWAEWVT